MDTDDIPSDEDEPPPKSKNSRYDKHCKTKLRCFGGVWHRLYAVALDDVEATRIKNSIKKGPDEHVKIIRENDYRLVYYGDEYMFKPRPNKHNH